MTKNNPPYSDLYKGYFDIRDPYTEGLEESYQRPVPIPIYTAEELFDNQLIEDIDQHIFRYFHFVAARRFQIESLKAVYRAYHQVKQDLERQKKIYLTMAGATHTNQAIAGAFKTELEYLFENEHYQFVLSGTARAVLQEYEHNMPAALKVFNILVHEVHLTYKRALLDFQSNLEEERKIAILTAY